LDFNINLGKITKVRFARFTIPKNLLLNWLYSSDRNVSLDKLGKWLENNTGGQYKLVKNNIKTEAA